MLVLMIDGLNLIRRVHAAVPAADGGTADADGVLVSCLRSVRRALEDALPTHALCALDGPGSSWRHELLVSYKAARPAMPADLAALLPRIEAGIEDLGIRCLRVPGFEADDVIAAIATRIAAHGASALILSTDKSMLSLLGQGIRVRNHFEHRDLDASYVRQRFGVDPADLPTLWALVGDRSLGIPGVPSVGAKTAARLIGEHRDLETILAHAREMPGRIGEQLRMHSEDARLSLRLNRLRTDVEVGLSLKDCRLRIPPPDDDGHSPHDAGVRCC